MASPIGQNKKILFANQGKVGSTVDFVSAPFRTDNRPSQVAFPQLKMFGDLDGGSAKIQTCDASKNPLIEGSADNSLDSADWQDTDDSISLPLLLSLYQSKLWHRVKLSNLGDSADVSAEVIDNA